jgi:hypothetical protein
VNTPATFQEENAHMKTSTTIIRATLLAALVMLTGPAPVEGQVTGINYAIAPAAQKVFWDDNSVLRDGMFYGGQLGFGFGRYFEMSGLYMRGDGFRTDFSRYTRISAPLFVNLQAIPTRDTKLELMGGEAKFNFGAGGLVPFITIGTGVIRFSPGGLTRSDNIYWSGGAGFFYALDERFTLTVSGQDLAYRYNPSSGLLGQGDYTASGLQASDFGKTTVHNWGIRAGIRAFLGGRRNSELSELDRDILDQFSGGFSGLSVQLTPAYGHIGFNKALGFPESQNLIGINAGFGFGPFIGIRGFYWRGLEEGNGTKFDKIQLYGGEINLKLNSGEGAIPFFVVGIGRLDVLDGYRNGPAGPAKDQTFAIAGGGLNFNISRSVRLQGAVRSLLVSSSGTDVTNPSSIYGSPMYSLGINFAIGGGADRPDIVRTEVMTRNLDEQAAAHVRELEQLRRDAALVEDSLTAEIARAEMRGDSAAVLRMRSQKSQAVSIKEKAIAQVATTTPAGAASGETISALPPLPAMRDSGHAKPSSNVSDKVIMVPVPEEGEIYIRYGKPGSVTIETIPGEAGDLIGGSGASGSSLKAPAAGGDTLSGRATTGTPGAGAMDSAALAAMEQRIMARLESEGMLRSGDDDEKISDLEEKLARLRGRMDDSRAADGTRVIGTQPGGVDVTISNQAVGGTARGLKVHSVYSGFNFISGHTQGLLGIRADYGTIFNDRVMLLPEFTFGLAGGTTSYLLALDAVVPLRIAQAEPVRPYAGIGIGLLAFTTTPPDFSGIQGVFNIILGGEYPAGPGNLFLEYSNINLFDLNRILFGYRFGI